jgi:hypothetical protein
MLIAVIVVAAVAVGLLVLYLGARSSAAEYQAQAEKREAALSAERDELSTAKAGLETELVAARAEHERSSAEEAEKKAKLAEEVRRQGAKLEEADRESEEQRTEIADQAEKISELESQVSTLGSRIVEAEAAAAAANARNAGIVVGDVVDLGASQPQTLWDLEVKRSERTWRTSVAPNPAADATPFTDADDPVRVAVEIEASALRENVGAFITIDWQAEPFEDPARRHLVVRVAQEMLESAARSPEASRLVVTQVSVPTDGDSAPDEAGGSTRDEIKLRLEAADEDEVVNIIPPRITSDLIDVRDETTIAIKPAPSPGQRAGTRSDPADADADAEPVGGVDPESGSDSVAGSAPEGVGGVDPESGSDSVAGSAPEGVGDVEPESGSDSVAGSEPEGVSGAEPVGGVDPESGSDPAVVAEGGVDTESRGGEAASKAETGVEPGAAAASGPGDGAASDEPEAEEGTGEEGEPEAEEGTGEAAGPDGPPPVAPTGKAEPVAGADAKVGSESGAEAAEPVAEPDAKANDRGKRRGRGSSRSRGRRRSRG